MDDINFVADRRILTIAIPTFNRGKDLHFCLSRILAELRGLSAYQQSLVGVYVSDNASTDNTPDVVKEFKSLGGEWFDFSRNETNIGGDRNISNCYDAAKTPYVWILGDDDVIVSGSLGKVLDVIADNKVDILYLNNYWFEGRYEDRSFRNKPEALSKFDDALRFVHRTNVMLTFISGLVVRSNVGKELRKDFLDTNLVQLSWVFPLLIQGGQFVVMNDFAVAAKGSNSGGYGLVNVFGVNLKKNAINFFGPNSKLTKSLENGVIVNFFPDFVLGFRRGGKNFSDQNMSSGLYDVFKENWRYYFFLAPLFFLPLPAATWFCRFVRLCRRFLGVVLIR